MNESALKRVILVPDCRMRSLAAALVTRHRVQHKVTVFKWNMTAASAPVTRHFCGEAHASLYQLVLIGSARHPHQTS